ncbi:MAG: DNA-directed RNA polymerase subunit omega [Acetanaerobacterium sp.]
MLRPAISEILKGDASYFSLVIGVAKRAREITDDVERIKKDMIERNNGKLPADMGVNRYYLQAKPVKLAVEELKDEKYRLVEAPHIGAHIET